MCKHADINETEVGFVVLISGNLRLGRSIVQFQTSRKQIVGKLVHWLISDILRWSFLERTTRGRLHDFAYAVAAAVRLTQKNLVKLPRPRKHTTSVHFMLEF